MSEELKACPFCKSHYSGYVVERSGLEFYQCQNCDARVNSFDDWNHRPIEDALQSEITRLTQRVQELEAQLKSKEIIIDSKQQEINKLAKKLLKKLGDK